MRVRPRLPWLVLGLALAVALVGAAANRSAEAGAQATGGADVALVRLAPGNPPRADLVLLDATGRTPGSRLGPLRASPRPVGPLTLTPDGNTILFTGGLGERDRGRYVTSRSDIFAADLATAGVRRLTRLGDAGTPVVSPDGRTVLFARQSAPRDLRRVGSNLWVMSADGSDPRALTPLRPGRLDSPGSFSPDGRGIVFARTIFGGRDERVAASRIWSIGADASAPTPLAEGRDPAVAPDGSRVAFVRAGEGEICGGEVCRPAGDVFTMAADGTDQRPLTRSRVDEGRPSWSPDGALLAIERRAEVGNGATTSVWLLNADGGCLRPLARDLSRVVGYSGPAWRPGAAPGPLTCPGPAPDPALATRIPLGLPTLAEARRSTDYPLYWLGPRYRGRRPAVVLREDRTQRLPGVGRLPRVRTTTVIYGDCARAPDRRGCESIHFQVSPVCSIPPAPRRGPGAGPLRRIRLRGAAAFLFAGGMWELHTRHVVVRVFAGGRRGRQVLVALRGLNPPAGGVRAGRPLPPPAPGALSDGLPCHRAFDFLGRPIPPGWVGDVVRQRGSWRRKRPIPGISRHLRAPSHPA